ncbi:F172A protein, partial [Atractosteus spatula]|nr:F172A protein [Atractosteus spatula]
MVPKSDRFGSLQFMEPLELKARTARDGVGSELPTFLCLFEIRCRRTLLAELIAEGPDEVRLKLTVSLSSQEQAAGQAPRGRSRSALVLPACQQRRRFAEVRKRIVTQYVYELLEKECNMTKEILPVDATAEEPKSFIFLSRDALSNPDRLLVLIQGSGVVRAGQWSRRLIINEDLDSGTQIPFIRRAVEEGHGVMVLNPNENYLEVEKPGAPAQPSPDSSDEPAEKRERKDERESRRRRDFYEKYRNPQKERETEQIPIRSCSPSIFDIPEQQLCLDNAGSALSAGAQRLRVPALLLHGTGLRPRKRAVTKERHFVQMCPACSVAQYFLEQMTHSLFHAVRRCSLGSLSLGEESDADNSSPEEHAIYVWDNFISKSAAKKIFFVAHSYGGLSFVELTYRDARKALRWVLCSEKALRFRLSRTFGCSPSQEITGELDVIEEPCQGDKIFSMIQREAEVKNRVCAVAMTDSVHNLWHQEAGKSILEWMQEHCCNWVSSAEPLDTPVETMLPDCPRVSAGTERHELTSWKSFHSIFKFFSAALEGQNWDAKPTTTVTTRSSNRIKHEEI